MTDPGVDVFLAVAGHELRTPLTVLRGVAETLDQRWEELDDAARRELVRIVLGRATAMSAIVEQLVLGSYAGAAQAEVDPRPVDLTAVVRDVLAGTTSRTASPDHPVTLVADGPVPAVADPRTLEPVLGQLLENAVRYSPGGGPLEVSVRREAATVDGGPWAAVTVADRGSGIAPEDLERVFERFVRGGLVAPSAHGAGMGLGLWIVRRYVEAQGGTVSARGREGGGTVVTVRFPGRP